MVTGHRPQHLDPAERAWAQTSLARVAHRCASAYGSRVAISGLALGVDTWWAVSSLAAGLDLHAFIPFLDQPKKWPYADQVMWQQLRAAASREVVVGGQEFDVRHLHARNRAMLDEADLVVAVFKAGTSGGTAGAVREAGRRRTPLLVLDPSARTVTTEHFTARTGGTGT